MTRRLWSSVRDTPIQRGTTTSTIATTEAADAARAIGAAANGAPFGFADAIAAASVSQVVMNVLFFVPFETGTREAGLLLVARLLGLPPAFGVYAAIVTRLRELTWIAIGVLLVWAGGGKNKGERPTPVPPER